MRIGKIRTQSQCFLKTLDSLIYLIEFLKRSSQVIAGFGKVRPQRQRVAEGPDRFLQATLLGIDKAQVAYVFGSRWLQLDRAMHQQKRFITPPGLIEE